jgi:hypothetical protein
MLAQQMCGINSQLFTRLMHRIRLLIYHPQSLPSTRRRCSLKLGTRIDRRSSPRSGSAL